mmetsp:Transcript_21396/g.63966  ORF Transcript_21396/g.63966 Transcript_21396/m.63966 type:complete len:144 (+) Transcript_21396:451-882(+)
MQMAAGMGEKFRAAGLPFAFTDKALVANTRDAHRVLAWAGAAGPEAQDAAAEVIFYGYFAEEKAPNDAALLVKACVAAGKSEADARAFLDDKNAMGAEVSRELTAATRAGVRGVPHFVIRKEGQAPVEVSGAQPPSVLARALL